jgi:hypothetical protein
VRTVKTSSGATAVQIVYSSHGGSREIEYLGSAHSGVEVELLKGRGVAAPGRANSTWAWILRRLVDR